MSMVDTGNGNEVKSRLKVVFFRCFGKETGVWEKQEGIEFQITGITV